MRTIIESLVAGVPSVYNIAGSHLEILSAEFPLSVSIQDANGVEITNGQSQNILAGTYFVPQKGFDRFTITSTLAQEVTIGVSFGESGTRRVAGTVTIAGTPSVNIANPNAKKQYFEYAASFKSTAALIANTPQTIFTPASNLNGAIIWTADIAGSAPANIDRVAAMVAKSGAAPTSVIDGDIIVTAKVSLGQYTAGYYLNNGELIRPVLIPAGKGIYFIASAAESAGVALRSVLYTLL